MLALANKLTISTQPIYRFVNKYSIDFDGVDDRIITDGADTVVQNTTYSFWCKSSTTVQNWGVFGHGSFKEGAFHFNQNANRPLLYLGSSYYVYWNDTPAQDDGEWHHWVVYLDTSSVTNCKLYIDGVLQTISASVNTPSDILPYTESLTIGSDQQVGGNSFEGKIDEFAVYDRELTQAEITRMYNTYYSPNRVANGNFSQIGNEEVTNGDFSQIGSELVTNGDFATDSDWNFVGDGSISNGELILPCCISNNRTSQNIGMSSSKSYKLEINITEITSGDTIDYLQGGAWYTFGTQLGINTAYITNPSDSVLYLRNSNGVGTIKIDNVSVKEVGQDWDFGGGWTMGDGKATATLVAATYLQQNGILTSGKIYKITYTVSDYVQGKVRFRNSGVNGNQNSGNGTFTDFIIAAGSNFGIQGLNDDGGFTGSVDNITVKEVGQHWAAESGVTFQPIDGIATIISNGSFTGINQDTSINFGNTYRVTIEHKNTTADFRVYVGNQAFDTISTASDFTTSVVDIVAVGTSQTVFILPSQAAQTIQVKSIVVQELKHDATNLMLNAGDYQSANPLITSTKSMEFDGSDDYLQLSEPFSYTNHTICAWVYNDAVETDEIFSASDSVNSGIRLMTRSTGKFRYRLDDVNIESGTGSFVANKWYFIAATYDGTNAKIYVNGVLENTVSTTKTFSTTTNARIGSQSYNEGALYDGNITEVGTWDRTLTALEVASLYNQGMPTNLLVNRNNYQSGNPTVFNTKQVDFDGADDYMQISEMGLTGTFTLSCWYLGSPDADFIFGESSSNKKIGFDSGKYGIRISSDYDNTISKPDGTQWNHIVLTRDASNKIDLYVNGGSANRLFSDAAQSSTVNFDLFGKTSVGQNYDGKISQIGVWNSTLTANEVSSLYNHGLPIDLSTDQAAYESSSNLVGYWRMGSGTLDSYPLIADQTNATLGSEQVVNGDFATNSDWDLGSSWSISGGKANYDAVTTASELRQLMSSIAVGKTIKIQFDILDVEAGKDAFFKLEIDGTPEAVFTYTKFSAGTYTYYHTISTAFDRLTFFPLNTSTGGAFSIDNISVKQVNGNPAIMTNQTSSDIENGSPYANIVQNGTFDTDTDWTKGGGWSISNGELVGNNANGLTYQGISAKPNTSYKVTFTVSNYVSGNVLFQFNGGSNTGTPRTSVGTYTEYITTDASVNGNFSITRTQNFTGSVDNVTVAEVNTGLQGYWKMGDGTNDEYPVIYDQTNPTLGSELVTNGNFATEDDWTLVNVGFSAGAITFDSLHDYIFQGLSFTVGKTYKLVVTKTGSGTPRFRTGHSGSDGTARSVSNNNISYFTATSDTNRIQFYGDSNSFDYVLNSVSVVEVQGNPATMTNMVEGNITNQYPLTKIRNYYRMGDGILDGYPIIQDQTSPNLAHIPTTNLFEYSEDFSQWSELNNAVVTTNQTTSPIGTLTADKFTFDGTTDGRIEKTISVTNGNKYTFSIYLKNNDLSDVTQVWIGFSSVGHQGQYFTITNEWQRYSITETSNGSSEYPRVLFSGTGSLFAWGGQVEEQSQATAYIKSDGIAAVRKSSTTNLLNYSEDFSQASQLQNVTLTANAITSPTGTSNGTKVLSSDNNSKVSYTGISFTNGTTYTLSVYCRNIDATALKFFVYNAGGGDITDDFTSQVNTTSWTRVSTTFTASQDTSSGQVQFARNLPSGESAYFWGVQLEEQTQAETYAKTTGLPVTIDLFTENNYGTMTNMSASDIVEDTP